MAALPGSMHGALYYQHIELLNKQHGLKYTLKETMKVMLRLQKNLYQNIHGGRKTKYVPKNKP